MGTTASIISAILKSVVGDKLGSGLLKELTGISIDGVSEKGINEITNFFNKGKLKIDNILFEEKNKYVVTEIKNLLSKIIITDEVLGQCKYDSMNLSDFLWNEYRECKNDYIECESEIKLCLFIVAEALNKLVRESENFEKDVLIHLSNSVDDANVGLQKISEYMDNNFGKLSADNRAILEILQMILEQNQKDSEKNKEKRQPIKSKTQEYANKWDSNMFLNDFDEWDENAGINVKLSDVYIDEHLPHFIYGYNEKVSDNLAALLSKYIVKTNKNKMLLILGQPGIGKSTLITWITVKFNEYLENILVYKFAEDLKDIDWRKSNISMELLDTLKLSYDDLRGKILILDGFDEVSIGVDRKGVLDNLYEELIYKDNIKNFSLIITCRENYIQRFQWMKCDYITLQSWSEKQIKSFCNTFQARTNYFISDDMLNKLFENKRIMGIPLILYMVLALNISIEKESSIVDVYDKIFSLEGGIYDRCIDNKNFETKHRIGEVKKEIHQISREIAIWMFENEPEDVYIAQKEYYCICDNIAKTSKREDENYVHDFLIGNFVQLNHCEGIKTERISFVHRSIYEYFVAETIYSSIESAMIALSDISQIELAEKIVVYLKQGNIEHTIGEFLKHKILKIYTHLSYENQCKFYQWWEEALDKMINVGMFYYENKSVKYYKNIINKEIKCFVNILKIIQSLFEKSNREYMLLNVNRANLEKYLKYTSIEHLIFELDLSRMNLAEIDLREVDLHGVNLQSSNLTKANLEGKKLEEVNLNEACLCKANLTNTNLEGANLTDAYLEGAKIDGINLKNAIIKGIVLDENQLQYLEKVFRYKMVVAKVFVSECNKIYDYESYQRFRKMKKKN